MAIKIKVELDADVQRLTDSIQRAVTKGFTGGGTQGLATNPSSVIRQIAGTQGAGMRGYRDPMGGESLPATPDFLNNPRFFWSKILPPTIASVQQRNQAQQASFLKNIGFAGIPVLSPGSVLGNLFATRQIFSGLSGPVGQGLLGKAGIGGTAGTAAVTGVLMAGLLAVGVSLKALQAALKGTIAAFDEARKIYAKALTSGLGIQFTVGRSNLAEILGVSETDVLKFGAALAVLGPKLKFSTDVISRTTPNLTSVAWEFGVMKKNLEALFFTLANDASPTLRRFADGISQVTNAITRFVQNSPAFIYLFKLWAQNMLPIFSQIGKDSGPAPLPQGQMKQLPASALERMGLVVGGFGGNTSAERTAKATEKSAKLLEKLVVGVTGSGSGGTFYSPLMSNP